MPATTISHLPDDVLGVVFSYVAEDTSMDTAGTVYGLPKVCRRWKAVCKGLVSPVFAPLSAATPAPGDKKWPPYQLIRSLVGPRFRTDGVLPPVDNGFLARHSHSRRFLPLGLFKQFNEDFGARLLSEAVDPFRSLQTLAFSGGYSAFGSRVCLTDAVLERVADQCPLLERFELGGGFQKYPDDAVPAAFVTTKAVNYVLQRCRKLRTVALVACQGHLEVDPAHPLGLGLAGSTVTDLTLVNEPRPAGPDPPNPHAFTGHGVEGCAGLETLVLCDVCPPADVFKRIGEATSLKTLKLNRYTVRDYLTPVLSCDGIHHITSLTTLVVNDCTLNDATLRDVGRHCSKLESVSLFGKSSRHRMHAATEITDEGIAALAKGLGESLKYFNVGGFDEHDEDFMDDYRPVVTPTAACVVSVLAHCPNIVEVDAADLTPPRNIAEPGQEGAWFRPWFVLAAGELPHLERLTIFGGGAQRGRERGEGAGDAVLHVLAAGCPSLRHLDVQWERAWIQQAGYSDNTCVADAPVTEDGFVALAKGCPRLERIKGYDRDISDALFERLRVFAPNLSRASRPPTPPRTPEPEWDEETMGPMFGADAEDDGEAGANHV